MSKVYSIGIVGYGHFGRFIHELIDRLCPTFVIKIYSDREAVGYEPSTMLEVAQCDFLFLSVPINQYEAVLADICPLVSSETVIVDVATVKGYTMDLISNVSTDVSFISLHPMFGPESFIKSGHSVSGYKVVVTGHNISDDQYRSFVSFLDRHGVIIIEKSADEHDRELAETLFLTHYVGQVISHAGFVRTSIDTVSFAFLMDSVDSVKHDANLFEQVFKYNSYCREIVERFDRSEAFVRDQILKLSAYDD